MRTKRGSVLVSNNNLSSVLDELTTGTYAVDCETTGLRAYHGDQLFSLIIADNRASRYFNFLPYPNLHKDFVLPRAETLSLLKPFFDNPANIIFGHNIKFDMHMLAREGITLAGKVYDTEVNGRLLYNRHLSYSLSNLAAEIGLEKSTAVDEWIGKHKAYTWITQPGKAKKIKQPHFDRVPYEIITRYGEKDGEVTLALGKSQLERLEVEASRVPGGKLLELIETESRLTKVCFQMERTGIRVDLDYCREALAYERERADRAAAEFSDLAGTAFKDSNKVLADAFTRAGEEYPRTEKGNPSFTDDVLEGFTSPLAKLLQTYRDATKRANTYFSNFIYFADRDGFIHPNMRQAGTDTGRFSYSDPNLQNIPKEDNSPYPARRAFIPRPGYMFAMLDYSQQEFRLMLDYAGEMGVIDRILNEGLDVHQATADSMTVSRQYAKVLNFMLMYGGGAGKLAAALGVPLDEAAGLKNKYFEDLPAVSAFIRRVQDKVNRCGEIFNWAGRMYRFPPLPNPRTGRLDRYAYKAPNHLIQGGCADVMKIALVRAADLLSGTSSHPLLTVHDEILAEVKIGEEHVIGELLAMMESVYPYKRLPMTAAVDFSLQSWADKQPFVP